MTLDTELDTFYLNTDQGFLKLLMNIQLNILLSETSIL